MLFNSLRNLLQITWNWYSAFRYIVSVLNSSISSSVSAFLALYAFFAISNSTNSRSLVFLSFFANEIASFKIWIAFWNDSWVGFFITKSVASEIFWFNVPLIWLYSGFFNSKARACASLCLFSYGAT
ncbi:hypothetical protein KMZ28_00584|nr:hypothetical protein [Mycoplasmopsis arginini QMP CG1-2758]MDI3352521.1 hypothetical protein [Mycoplasmopsis arginini]